MLSHLTTLLIQAAPLSSTLNQTSPLSATLTQTAVASGTVTPTITITDTQLAANLPPLPGAVIPLYAVVIVLSLIFAIGLPLLVARRYGVTFRYMLWGALAGFASQAVVVPLIQQALGSVIGVPANPDDTALLGYSLLGSVVAAVVGVAAFYLINQLVLKWDEDRNWSAGLMTGVGAGVVLFALNFVLDSVGRVAFFLRWPLKAADIASLDASQKTQIPDLGRTVGQLSGYEPLAGLWLNISLAILQIAAAVLVIIYFRRREWLWLAGAAGLLFLGYGSGSVVEYILRDSLGILGTTLIEIVIYTLLTAVAIYLVFRVYEPPDVKPVLTPARVVATPDATDGEEPIMTDHPELEAPKPTKRRRRR